MRQLIAALLVVGSVLTAVAAPPPNSSDSSAAATTADWLRADLLRPGLAAASLDQVHQTDHFTIVYDRDAHRAALQGDLLEATHRRFYESLGSDDFHVRDVNDRLVCLLFEDKGEYLRYARNADRVDMAWTVAYYSARTNRIAFYRYGPLRSDAADRAPDQRSSDELYGSAATATALSHEHRISLASATHEAAHQLAFNSGLQKRGVLYPLWVSEGLATNFEFRLGDADFGPGHDNPTRRHRLRRAYQAGSLLQLHAFAAVTRPPTDDPAATDAYYAHAWGLFRYLYLEHRSALADYLADLATLPRGSRTPDTLRAEFEHHFGPIDHVERAWREWIAGL